MLCNTPSQAPSQKRWCQRRNQRPSRGKLNNVFTKSDLDEITKKMKQYGTITANQVHVFKQAQLKKKVWSVLSCLSDIEELAGNAWVPDTFCRKPRQTQDIASSSFTWAKILANGSEKAATYCFKKKNAETNYYHAMTFAACLPILGIEFSDRASDSHLEGLGFDPPYLQVHFFLHNCEPFLLCERWGCLMLIKNICSRQDSNLRFHRESHLCISANL